MFLRVLLSASGFFYPVSVFSWKTFTKLYTECACVLK